jgi:crossover junction endodeoxyribonuclease RusA
MIDLSLPWPPSVNRYWRTFQGRMIISAEGRTYRKSVADQVLIQRGAKHYQGKLKVEIEAWRPDNRRRDLDNLLKAVLDSLTHAGVWEDDGNIVDLRIYWADAIGGMLKVNIQEVPVEKP